MRSSTPLLHAGACALSCAALVACQSPAPPRPTSALPPEAAAAPASSAPPVLQAVTIRTNVPNGFGGYVSVVPDFHFIAPNGNAVYLRRELVATDGNFSGATIRGAAINIAPDVQRRGAVLSGGWHCGVAKYYVTLRAYVIAADGSRSNTLEYTIHCNGG